MVFIDLTKAFDSVDRAGFWQVLLKIGCPQKFVNIIRSLHEGIDGSSDRRWRNICIIQYHKWN